MLLKAINIQKANYRTFDSKAGFSIELHMAQRNGGQIHRWWCKVSKFVQQVHWNSDIMWSCWIPNMENIQHSHLLYLPQPLAWKSSSYQIKYALSTCWYVFQSHPRPHWPTTLLMIPIPPTVEISPQYHCSFFLLCGSHLSISRPRGKQVR